MSGISVYKLIYVVIHCLYAVYESVQNCLFDVIKKLQLFYHELLPRSEKNKHLQHQLYKIKKKPKHLTVLLGSEEAAFKDLANLIIWSIATQISFISFYDYKGNLKKREEELQYEVSRVKDKNDHVIWQNDPGMLKNGFIGNRIHVKVLTEEDAKKSVVNLTRDVALMKSKNISIETINEGLLKQYQFPDPDMGLVCGDTFSLFNYPPWQIRLTEFFRLKSIKDITFPVFVEQLVKFSKCEQRLGK